MVDNIALSNQELDALRMLLYIDGDDSKVASISAASPFFKDYSSKEDSSTIQEWLSKALCEEENDSWAEVPALTKCVTIRDEESALHKNIRLMNCEDSYIYIDAPIHSISITNCLNCTIMLAGVRKVCTVDKCEKTSVSVATSFLRIGSSVDCKIYSYTQGQTFMFGDNRNLQLAPFNAGYTQLEQHIRDAGLSADVAKFNSFKSPIQSKQDLAAFSILPPEDFSRCQLPSSFVESDLILTPQEYKDAIQKRQQVFTMIQKKIADRGLTGDQEKKLHVAIQGYFRDWLVNKGHSKEINDLIKMIE